VAPSPYEPAEPLSDPTLAGTVGPDPTLAPAGGFVTPSAQPAPPAQPIPPIQPASPWARPDTPAYMPPPYATGTAPVPPATQPVYQAAGPSQPGWPAYPPNYPTHLGYPTPKPATVRQPRGAIFFMVGALVLLAVVAIGVGALAGRQPSGNPAVSLSAPDNDPFGGNAFGGNPPGVLPFGGGSGSGAQVAPGDQAERLPIGRTVALSNSDSAWTVTITSASWESTCSTVTMMNGRPLEVTIVVTVTQGNITVSPLDFSYTDPDGIPGIPLPIMGCGSALDQATLSAGSEHTYTIDFEVLGRGGGVIGYGGMLDSIATWVAPD
jgi:hypothetical protein